MTTLTTAVPSGRYGLRDVLAMEWIKLRSLRSTWWTLAVTVAGAVALAAAVGAATKDATGDLTNNVLAGVSVGLLLTGVLGVLTMTGEHSSGLIRCTLTAVPDRRLVLVAKAAVFGGVALAAGEVASFVAFTAGTVTLPRAISAPALGDPGVLRAVLLSGAGYALIGLIGLGLGAIIRHTAAALGVLVGGVYVLGQAVAAVAHPLMPYVPVSIVANSLAVTRPIACRPGEPCADFLSPWAGLGVLALYAAVTLAIGGWLLTRRDA
jgi:ABC-2 type transport system permease protein